MRSPAPGIIERRDFGLQQRGRWIKRGTAASDGMNTNNRRSCCKVEGTNGRWGRLGRKGFNDNDKNEMRGNEP